MKSKLLFALLLIGGAGVSQLAAAADGTITFTGNVTAQTCTINGGTKDFTVALPTVPAGSLAAAGQTAGRTLFSISLTGCTTTTGNVHVFFEPNSTMDTNTGNLTVTRSTATVAAATNVQISLLNSDLTSIKLGAADALQNSKPVALSVTPSSATTSSATTGSATTGGATTGGAAAVTTATGNATLSYYAQYYATGVATAGLATSSVMYTVVYP